MKIRQAKKIVRQAYLRYKCSTIENAIDCTIQYYRRHKQYKRRQSIIPHLKGKTLSINTLKNVFPIAANIQKIFRDMSEFYDSNSTFSSAHLDANIFLRK